MTDVRNDIDGGKLSAKTEEAEETRYVPVAKLVKASPFQGDIAGSKPVGNTKDGDTWCMRNFRITKKDIIVAGNDYSRLSVLT